PSGVIDHKDTSLATPAAPPAPESNEKASSNKATPAPVPLRTRVINLVLVVTPLVGLVAAMALLWGRGFSWVELGLLVGGYLLTVGGVTVVYHGVFTHKAFETNRVVQFILAALGSMAVQGPLLNWVAQHRLHHQHSDDHDDPHSPHHHGAGLIGM